MKNVTGKSRRRAARRKLPLRVVIVVGCADTLVDVIGPYQIFLQASTEGGTPSGDELHRYMFPAHAGMNRLLRELLYQPRNVPL